MKELDTITKTITIKKVHTVWLGIVYQLEIDGVYDSIYDNTLSGWLKMKWYVWKLKRNNTFKYVYGKEKKECQHQYFS